MLDSLLAQNARDKWIEKLYEYGGKPAYPGFNDWLFELLLSLYHLEPIWSSALSCTSSFRAGVPFL